MIIFLLTSLFGIVNEVDCSIPETTLTTMYVHQTPMSWNDAGSTCDSIGGNLLSIKGNVANMALNSVISQLQKEGVPLSKFWIGLHQTEDDKYLWGDCSNLSSWQKWNQTNTNDSERYYCVSSDDSVTWVPTNCSEKLPFICETSASCGCSLQKETTICMDLIRSQYKVINGVSVEECKQLCMTHVSGQEECWGLSYSFNQCHLYEKMHLTTVSCPFNHQYFSKNCYSYKPIASTPIPSIQDDSEIPLTNCSEAKHNVSLQDTTTSVPCEFYALTTMPSTDTTTDIIIRSQASTHDSSSPETSSIPFSSATTSPNCVCYTATGNITVQERIEKLVSDLKVDSKNTTLSRMKKISAPDHRPSAQTIGVVGIIALVMVFGGIILLDLERIRIDVSEAVDKIKSRPLN